LNDFRAGTRLVRFVCSGLALLTTTFTAILAELASFARVSAASAIPPNWRLASFDRIASAG